MTEGVRRLAAYQDLAYARLYLDRLAADPRCRRQGQRRRPPARRNRAASRGAHVVRGRDPRRPGQDRSGALCAHRHATWASSRTSIRGHGIPQTRRRGILFDPAAVAGEGAFLRLPNGIRGLGARALGHGDQHRVGLRLSALLYARQAARFPAAEPGVSRRSSARIEAWLRLIARRRAAVRRTRHRDRRMCTPHQRLRRHPQARQR